MIYDNNLEKCNEFVTPSGNQFEVLYSSKVMDDGTIQLIESGKKDLQQEINSWIEHTDMAYVLRMMSLGQYPQRDGAMYGDFTQVPDNMIDTMQMFINAENAFYDLPLEIRQKFDGDYRKWLAMMNTDAIRFADLMGFQWKETDIPDESEGKEVVD